MMNDFYVVAICLVVLGIATWLVAMRIRPKINHYELQALAQEQLNTYRLRIKELGHEHELEALDEQEYQASVIDLKRQLLHDLSAMSQADTGKKTSMLLPGVIFLLMFIAAFFYTYGETSKLHNWQMAKIALPDLGSRALMGKGERLTNQELQQFALALRSKLHDDGEDANAWVVFGRVAMTLEDYDSAMAAFEKAFKMAPQKPAVLLGYAQMLFMTGEEHSVRRAAILLSELLKQQPNNLDAIWLVGLIAEQRGDDEQARISWQLLQQALPANDPRQQFLSQRMTASNGQVTSANDNSTPTSTKAIQVQLSLSAQLAAKLPENSTLFVYAKAASGRPMPAAVVKLNQFNFPLKVELSDANAMLPDYKLSSLSEVVIFARVSVDGDIAVSSGEMQGQSGTLVVTDTDAVDIVIDQLL